MAGANQYTLDSISVQTKRLTKFLKTLETVPTEILQEEATRIQAEIKLQTPVLTGKLQRNGKCRVTHDKRRPGLVASSTAIKHGYNYAIIQHENKKYKHPNGGKPFFIRDPFTKGVDRIIRRFKTEVKL